MKLTFHKNLEHHLVKNGFQINSNPKQSWQVFELRSIIIDVSKRTETLYVNYRVSAGIYFPIKGCKTIHDLYRLEKLIEGTNNQKSIK
jgi:hypothetical protein